MRRLTWGLFLFLFLFLFLVPISARAELPKPGSVLLINNSNIAYTIFIFEGYYYKDELMPFDYRNQKYYWAVEPIKKLKISPTSFAPRRSKAQIELGEIRLGSNRYRPKIAVPGSLKYGPTMSWLQLEPNEQYTFFIIIHKAFSQNVIGWRTYHIYTTNNGLRNYWWDPLVQEYIWADEIIRLPWANEVHSLDLLFGSSGPRPQVSDFEKLEVYKPLVRGFLWNNSSASIRVWYAKEKLDDLLLSARPAPDIEAAPGERIAFNLAVGSHRLVIEAYNSGQILGRVVHDLVIEHPLDNKSMWALTVRDSDFKD